MISFLPIVNAIRKKPCIEKQQLQDALFWITDEVTYRPPPCVKQAVVQNIGKQFGLKTLIESGTYSGDMVAACTHVFSRIISIELDVSLYEAARKRFIKNPSITIMQGDSAVLLPRVLQTLSAPVVFWLDAHYSGGTTTKGIKETPIMDELAAIFADREKRHVILIDDARDFIGKEGYPTIAGVKRYVMQRRPTWQFTVKHDIIRIHA